VNAPHIETSRLDLRPLPAAAAGALPGDREAAARIVGATLPASWPAPDLLDVLPVQAAAGPDEEPYGIWVVIERETNSVVGDIGFLGPPADGVVEVGFSVLPDRRRRGYATEAAQSLVAWALGQPDVRRVVARCDVDNAGSIGVLERVGFTRIREADRVIDWETTA
jgi:ribosomal-protein-alanine N-acetyltransferase